MPDISTLTLNTYGIRSINRKSFNTRYHDGLYFPKEIRDIVVTALRVHNGILNVLGYIPGVSLVSGSIRMATGFAIVCVTLTIGDRNAMRGAIIGHWYDEAIGTGLAQIVRGALEAFVPFGFIANAVLDVVATPINLANELEGSMACEGCMSESHTRPHEDVNYPGPLGILHFV